MFQGERGMKKIILIVSCVFLLGVAGAGIFFLLRDTPEKQIRRMLNELCEIVSKSRGENAAMGAFKANRTDKVFAPRCEIKFRHNVFDGGYTPTEIGANLLRFQTLFHHLTVSCSNLETAVSTLPGTRTAASAKIFFTGQCTGVLKNTSEKVEEIRDVEAQARYIKDKGWRITAITIHKVLKK